MIKPNFKDGYPFSKALFAVEMRKTEIKMNKPMYIGQAILDLNKTLVYSTGVSQEVKIKNVKKL